MVLEPMITLSQAGFFDAYPRFYTTSKTGVHPNRLNHRYRALIECNARLIQGKSILDLASHDGRWSFAAHKAGARYVMGIEARPYLVQFARENIEHYEIREAEVAFVLDDVFSALDRLSPGTFETVFCFGFLYHTLRHLCLLTQIARLKPESVIFDTEIDPRPGCFIRVHAESVIGEDNGAIAEAGDPTSTVVGVPNRTALELMLASCGLPVLSYFDWNRSSIGRWDGLEDYARGSRVSLVAVAAKDIPQ